MLTRACAGDNYGAVALCMQSQTPCPIPGDVHYWIYYRDLSITPPDTWHRLTNSYCLGPTPTPNLAALQAQVQREFRNLPLPRGSIQVQPPGHAVVNIPVIAYTDTPPSRTFTVSALGSTVSLTARPRSWTWHWGGGLTSTTTGPGAAYPTCQNASATCAAQTYHQTGYYGPISVTVDWGATYTIAGFSQTFTIADPVAVTSGGPRIAVDEAPPVLVYGGS